MAIKTHDDELEGVFDFLVSKFPNNPIHGECLRDNYPNNYKRMYYNNTAIIIHISNYGRLKNCIHFCREREILRLMKNES